MTVSFARLCMTANKAASSFVDCLQCIVEGAVDDC